MKNILLMALVMTIFITPSCKKSSNTDNNNNNNNNNNQTGLEALTSPTDSNYMVMVVSRKDNPTELDTVVWHSSASDSTYGFGAPFTSSGYVAAYQYYKPLNAAINKYESFSLSFRKSFTGTAPQSCKTIDSLIKVGVADPSNLQITLERDNYNQGSIHSTGDKTYLEVLNVTRLTGQGGCTVLRVKAKFRDIHFDETDSHCPFAFKFDYINEGIVQMDFHYYF